MYVVKLIEHNKLFQRPKVWKLIRVSLGFCSLCASRFLALVNVVFWEFMGPSPKTLLDVFGWLFSIPMSSDDTFQALGLLPFSGSLRVMIRLSESMLVHCSLFASPDLIAVSFRSLRNVAVFFPHPIRM